MSRFILPACVFLTLLCTESDAAELPYKGTWSGTIGKNKVQVCFADEWSAQYYYLSHKKSIGLARNEKDTGFKEWKESVRNQKTFIDEVTGVWKINQVTQDKLQGLWINPDNQKSLDINLSHLSTPKEGCDALYYAPMEQAIKYGTGKFENKAYKTIKTDAGETFEVPESIKSSKNLNVFIKSWLTEQTVESDECQKNGGEWQGTELHPIFWTENWLVMESVLPDTYCGGAHGNSAFTYHVFNLDAGKEINVWTWLEDGEKSQSENDAGKKTALRLLIEQANSREDCKDDNSFFLGMPHPAKKGLVFNTSHAHVDRACDDEVVINYQDLTPFLTTQGKTAVQSIMQAD